jgi:hypothetical protein
MAANVPYVSPDTAEPEVVLIRSVPAKLRAT